MSDLSRLLDDVYGSATVTSTVSRSAVATVAPTPVALPDPAPLPPVGPDPAELLEGFFDLGVTEETLVTIEDDGEDVAPAGPAPATRWQPGDDDILPPRGGRRLALRLRRS